MSFDAPRVGPVPPAIDDRLVATETRYEILEGRLVHVSPADPPHGTRHSKVSALLEAHTGLEFTVASDMLTRTSERSDVAPDVSVFPSAPDPRTGGRQLEQLAFEVVSSSGRIHREPDFSGRSNRNSQDAAVCLRSSQQDRARRQTRPEDRCNDSGH